MRVAYYTLRELRVVFEGTCEYVNEIGFHIFFQLFAGIAWQLTQESRCLITPHPDQTTSPP